MLVFCLYRPRSDDQFVRPNRCGPPAEFPLDPFCPGIDSGPYLCAHTLTQPNQRAGQCKSLVPPLGFQPGTRVRSISFIALLFDSRPIDLRAYYILWTELYDGSGLT